MSNEILKIIYINFKMDFNEDFFYGINKSLYFKTEE